MKFGYAKPIKWRVIYIQDDDDKEVKTEYLRVFNTHGALHSWMAQTEDKFTIVRMSIMYDYSFS